MSSDPGVDWLRGVTYSVLASIIGAASKLSIRKSWLVAAKLKQQAERDCQSADIDDQDLTRPYDAKTSTKNYRTVSPQGITSGHAFTDGNDRLLAPLEVAASSHNDSMDDSHSMNRDDGSCFFFDPIRESLPRSNSKQQNQKAISWILYASGMLGMTILNPLCCVLAMKYANPSILAPFSGLTLVWVVILSGCYLGERPVRRQKVACGLIILGQGIVAAFGDHTNKSDVTLEEVVSIVVIVFSVIDKIDFDLGSLSCLISIIKIGQLLQRSDVFGVHNLYDSCFRVLDRFHQHKFQHFATS